MIGGGGGIKLFKSHKVDFAGVVQVNAIGVEISIAD